MATATIPQPTQPTTTEKKPRSRHEAFMATTEGTPEYEHALDELLKEVSPNGGDGA